jgi:RNA polymerase sigma-70 factor (ECF subfamily)
MMPGTGQSAEFERLVRAYSGDLFRYACWLCRDRIIAEDLVQETFERAWKAREGLRDPGAVKTWLVTILRNEHARLYARKRLERVEGDPEDWDEGVDRDPGSALDLREALQELPEGLREPLVLQVLYGMSGSEIGKIMGISEGNVMTRLTRARQGMRRLLQTSNPLGRVKGL